MNEAELKRYIRLQKRLKVVSDALKLILALEGVNTGSGSIALEALIYLRTKSGKHVPRKPLQR